ncbi:hypothetical protein [Terrimonas pollutisoli]|uniref:hypothetical protein n=1 Tax=Terrimonas pollutisoli TaxID=3034147 RepID=UPI0023ED7F4C|nr:hypothetical protein [Terrimonas sp. H1YJ31]
MKQALLSFILLLAAAATFSQTTIKLEQAKDHIGDSVHVCGLVASARYISYTDNAPTFLNLGAAYPNQLLTVLIWQNVRDRMQFKPENFYLKKEICVIGRLELHREKPQIVINDTSQIRLKE